MNKQYSISVIKNDYSEIKLASIDSGTEILDFKDSSAEPLKFRGFFNNDIISIDSQGYIKLIKRQLPKIISGVIELFSVYKYKPNKRGIPSYIFKPLDRNLPNFIVCTKIKRKSIKNRLITIRFMEWTKDSIFPKGELVRDLGDYDNIYPIELSLLYYFDIYPNKTNYKLDKKTCENFTINKDNLMDNKMLLKDKIFSIDPAGCKDIDDAFSLRKTENNVFIDIHIADVYYLLKKLNLLDRVNNFTSIYLNDSILHMIDNKISTNYASLIEKKFRYMITLSIQYNIENQNVNYTFKKTYGKITKNFSYENYPKWIDSYFPIIENLFYQITRNNISIVESHKFIEALMIIYNNLFTKYLINNNKSVIYRSQKKSDKKSIQQGELGRFLNILYSNSAEYSIDNNYHTSLNIFNYTHATSPIRRIIDLLNQSMMYQDENFKTKFSIEDINSYGKTLKKFYRKANKLKLAKSVYIEGLKKLNAYIYDFDGEKVDIYLPKFKFNIRQRLVDKKIRDKFKINVDNSQIKIINLEDCSEKKILMNSEIEILITGKPNIFNIESSIKITF